VTMDDGEMEWSCVVGKVPWINVSTALDQELNNRVMIAEHGKVQRGRLLETAAHRVSEIGSRVQKGPELGHVAGLRRTQDRAYCTRIGLRSGVALPKIAH